MSERPRPTHRAPSECPVCADQLEVTRLGCASCGTELAGEFAGCPFCALDDADLEMLKVFLTSRGNLREVEKHLGVSYPTARARFTTLLVNLGLEKQAPVSTPVDRDKILADVAAGVLTPAEAQRILAEGS